MENYDDHESLTDFPIDSDYIDNEQQRADIDVSDEKVDEYERDPQFLPSKQSADLSHTYGRQAGDGPQTRVEVEQAERDMSSHNKRGGTRTGMDIGDAEGYYDQKIIRNGKLRTRAEWLNMLQDGYRDEDYTNDSYKMDNAVWVDTFCSKLSVTPYQQARVQHLIESVSLNHFGRRTVEIIVLAAIQEVAEADSRDVTGEQMFKTIVSTVDTSLSEVERTKELLNEKSPLL